MKLQIYTVEVGVCLPKTHNEYEFYKAIPGFDYSLYDENFAYFTDKDKAIQYATDYIEKGVPNTYGMITDHGTWNLTPEAIQEIKAYGYTDGLWKKPLKENIIWFNIKAPTQSINYEEDSYL